jgi:hypothetical protein
VLTNLAPVFFRTPATCAARTGVNILIHSCRYGWMWSWALPMFLLLSSDGKAERTYLCLEEAKRQDQLHLGLREATVSNPGS